MDHFEQNVGVELHGEKVLLRPVVDSDVKKLDKIVREPEVAAWWSTPDDYEAMLAITLGGEIIGAVQYEEEADPEFWHAGIDIFLAASAGTARGSARTMSGRRAVADRGARAPSDHH
ncbi:hypothetical protein G3I29_18995 [Streptomyces halstedii]|uniref:GNAT family N-acetyltransferase n=1 Tax=Streptomyces halstedii TaxID=1944 RepID=A0A6N9U195_STRHA|nr:hypothetical protein [Streptomyces halstedii]